MDAFIQYIFNKQNKKNFWNLHEHNSMDSFIAMRIINEHKLFIQKSYSTTNVYILQTADVHSSCIFLPLALTNKYSFARNSVVLYFQMKFRSRGTTYL